MNNVLVIEDNEDNLKLVTYALKRVGYTVIAAASGEEGVELALRERPLFILMDINLPGMDGIEATKRIRASTAEGAIPIIAITSYAMAGDRERIMASGCNGCIEKPIDPLIVMDQIHEIIKRSGHENTHR